MNKLCYADLKLVDYFYTSGLSAATPHTRTVRYNQKIDQGYKHNAVNNN